MPTICYSCNRRILRHARIITCTICHEVFHLKCLPANFDNINNHLESDFSQWICTYCSSECFPFNHFTEQEEFLQALSELWQNYKSVPYIKLQEMVFNPFEWNDENPNLPNFDVDPDIQYFNDMANVDNMNMCNYYMPEDMCKNI